MTVDRTPQINQAAGWQINCEAALIYFGGNFMLSSASKWLKAFWECDITVNQRSTYFQFHHRGAVFATGIVNARCYISPQIMDKPGSRKTGRLAQHQPVEIIVTDVGLQKIWRQMPYFRWQTWLALAAMPSLLAVQFWQQEGDR